jgi:hypothetical protein
MDTSLSMLRTCAYLDCHTVTLGTYCLEHETLVATDTDQVDAATDGPLTRDWAATETGLTALPDLPAA